MTDALKPVWAEAVLFPGGAQKILALADEEAAAHYRGASWMSAALVHLGIEVKIVVLPDDVRAEIRISPSPAACSSRAAAMTASPVTNSCPDEPSPATTSPLAIPVRAARVTS